MKLKKELEILLDLDKIPFVFKNPNLHASVRHDIKALKEKIASEKRRPS